MLSARAFFAFMGIQQTGRGAVFMGENAHRERDAALYLQGKSKGLQGKSKGLMIARWVMAACASWAFAAGAWAGGPRFITGTSGYAQAGVPMAWYTSQPMYYTDPGQLSSGVSHAQSDAMVAAAAAVWNLPMANVTLAQGGELAEHVSGSNSYFNGTDFVFPNDVEAANYQAIQIAVIYDTDGSITDLLLGSGASGPLECRQNGVTESVDSFGTGGAIQHAVIVLNGLCVGSSPQQMTQMQYQLMRTFGRVLGLAWSQLNDNVFTGVATVTAAQMAVWPVMHPIDIVCGPYTYQCMQNPFTLRPDDVAALTALYPVASSTSGKIASGVNTASASGTVQFTTRQGMEVTNVTMVRWLLGTESGYEPYPILSSTTGYTFQQNGGNPVTGPEPDGENAGADAAADEGAWRMPYIPVGAGGANVYFGTETINPLYSGEYAVGPYQRPVVAMSGSPNYQSFHNVNQGASINFTMQQQNAAWNWCMYPDGTEANPVVPSSTGFWNELLCAADYTAWRTTGISANTSWTIEVTALDETGGATVQKLQPVIGVWNMSDPGGVPPTVASQTGVFNSFSPGMTQLQVPAVSSPSTVRIAIADQFGGGRPDFAYKARIFYAGSITPTTLGAGGGQITVAGTGFAPGNQVWINDVVAATVVGVTPTQIVATVPPMATAGAALNTAVDVLVYDPNTGAVTDMSPVLTYGQQTGNVIALVSSPAALETGYVAATPFAVRVYGPDGVTPAAGASVTFAVTGSGGGAAVATHCGSGTVCVVTTDGTGLAQTPLMGVAPGSVTVTGTAVSSGATVQATMVDANPVQTVTIGAAPQYLAAGAPGSWSVALTATQDGAPAVGAPVRWTTSAVGFALTPANGVTATNGAAAVSASVGAIASGSTNLITGCVWAGVCASWTVYGVAPTQWTLGVVSGGSQSVVLGAAQLGAVMLLVTDGAGHVLPGATVHLYQTAYAWEGVCATAGPCASAPVLAQSQSSAVSDGNGLVRVQPQVVAGVPQTLKIAASTGMNGFAAVALAVTP